MRILRSSLKGVPVLALLLAGSLSVALYAIYAAVYGVPSATNAAAGPGILLELRLYEVDPIRGRLVDVTHLLDRPDTLIYLEINAMAPPDPRWREDVVTLVKITAKPRRAMFFESEELLEISRGWVSVYESRGGDPEGTYSGLIVRLFIYNGSSGEIMFEAYDSLSYKPVEIARGRSLRVSAGLVRGSQTFAHLDVRYGHVSRLEAEAFTVTSTGN